MLDPLFFTLEDVRTVRKVSVNIDDFEQFAQEVQRNYVEKVLGPNLYSLLLDDLIAGVPQSTRFINLVDGVDYTKGSDTIKYRGLKLYSCYAWLYFFLLSESLQMTPIGSRIFIDDEANDAEGRQSNRQSRDHFIRTADDMESKILTFLRDNSDTYPEFKEMSNNEPAAADNFSFAVIGNTYRAPDNYFNK